MGLLVAEMPHCFLPLGDRHVLCTPYTLALLRTWGTQRPGCPAISKRSCVSTQLAVHVGMDASTKVIILEQCGKNRGYRDADVRGFRPEDGVCLPGGPEVMESVVSMKAACKHIALEGVDVAFSRDAGRCSVRLLGSGGHCTAPYADMSWRWEGALRSDTKFLVVAGTSVTTPTICPCIWETAAQCWSTCHPCRAVSPPTCWEKPYRLLPGHCWSRAPQPVPRAWLAEHTATWILTMENGRVSLL